MTDLAQSLERVAQAVTKAYLNAPTVEDEEEHLKAIVARALHLVFLVACERMHGADTAEPLVMAEVRKRLE